MRYLQTRQETAFYKMKVLGEGGGGGIIFQPPIIEKKLMFKTVSTQGSLQCSTQARNKTIILWSFSYYEFSVFLPDGFSLISRA